VEGKGRRVDMRRGRVGGKQTSKGGSKAIKGEWRGRGKRGGVRTGSRGGPEKKGRSKRGQEKGRKGGE